MYGVNWSIKKTKQPSLITDIHQRHHRFELDSQTSSIFDVRWKHFVTSKNRKDLSSRAESRPFDEDNHENTCQFYRLDRSGPITKGRLRQATYRWSSLNTPELICGSPLSWRRGSSTLSDMLEQLALETRFSFHSSLGRYTEQRMTRRFSKADCKLIQKKNMGKNDNTASICA